MVEVSNFDVNVHSVYAKMTAVSEDFRKIYKSFFTDTMIANNVIYSEKEAELSQLETLMGVRIPFSPTALFTRFISELGLRSPFEFNHIGPHFSAPSGTYQIDDVLEYETERVNKVSCTSSQDLQKQKDIAESLIMLKTLNRWSHFIVGRIGQYLIG